MSLCGETDEGTHGLRIDVADSSEVALVILTCFGPEPRAAYTTELVFIGPGPLEYGVPGSTLVLVH